jgi:uncharacterized surface protein with fasciclin (FAS1) repeats
LARTDVCQQRHYRQRGEFEDPHHFGLAAIKAADLVATLKGPRPVCVFAPANAAFAALPAGTVDTLLRLPVKPRSPKILTYHVVAGKMDGSSLMKAIADGMGKATLKTVSGSTLTAQLHLALALLSRQKKKAVQPKVTIRRPYQSNGVIPRRRQSIVPK